MVPREDLVKVADFGRFLTSLGVRIDSLYLYGSRVRRKGRESSDIDVAVISGDFTGNFLDDLEKIMPALLQSDPAIEAVFFPPEDFQEENPLVWEILHTGVKISPS
ncbi:MAG: hypothetical protein COX46_02020 [bacterium (Candidatus Ratteibacteria) CG23_combo_of_CG06-09_8_20_14_all_48_7]|uniref:Polymerase beta nucleotidyltransferase domain-containing protein n=1 Tax=bacterium (Candidatus Ratteibacteria) CG23_combo_of_CG06-09_8_20_14_all_48_7 TaxID=2014292 RepID=A0A2G9YCN1_9BACT|nr:MAG: hypothetical protein COX46_02020 [bacterium (Candidatus Ratteibacteria) CG23_combo_of_CG06-09_8_20_14_all_48_7]